MTVGDLYNQVLNFEARRSLYRGTQENTVNVANKGGGRGSFPGRGGGAPRAVVPFLAAAQAMERAVEDARKVGRIAGRSVKFASRGDTPP